MDSRSKPKRKSSLVWREVDEETVIISPDNKSMQVLNDVGSKIWALLDGEHDLEMIAALISSEYGEEEDIVKKDLAEYIESIRQMNMLEG